MRGSRFCYCFLLIRTDVEQQFHAQRLARGGDRPEHRPLSLLRCVVTDPRNHVGAPVHRSPRYRRLKGSNPRLRSTNTIGRDNFCSTRYVQLDVAPDQVTRWDEAVAKGSVIYSTHTYNFLYGLPNMVVRTLMMIIYGFARVPTCILDNCHSYVAECLTQFPFSGRSSWNMVILCFWMFLNRKYVDTRGFLKTWLPFALATFIVT